MKLIIKHVVYAILVAIICIIFAACTYALIDIHQLGH